MKITKKSVKYKGVFEYKNSSGTFWGYRLKYYDKTHKRREKKQLSFTSEFEAFENMVEMQNNIHKENFHKVNPSKMTLGELADLIIEQRKPGKNGAGIWSYSSYSSYKTLRDNWLPGTIAHVKLKDLSLELYQAAFINHYRESANPETLRSVHGRVNTLMNEAVKREYVLNNRIRFAELPKSYEEKVDKIMTIEELKSLLEASTKLKQHFHVMFYLFAYSGMRIGELRALKWSDINFKECKINVSKSIDQDHRLGQTKGRNKRIIEINREVINMLKELKKKKMSVNRFRNNNDFVFISQKMINPISAATIQGIVNELSEESIGKKITTHYFRHTHASILLMSGQSAKAVARRLGNTEKTIIDHYSHFIPGITISAADAFDQKLNSGAKGGANSKTETNIISLNH